MRERRRTSNAASAADTLCGPFRLDPEMPPLPFNYEDWYERGCCPNRHIQAVHQWQLYRHWEEEMHWQQWLHHLPTGLGFCVEANEEPTPATCTAYLAYMRREAPRPSRAEIGALGHEAIIAWLLRCFADISELGYPPYVRNRDPAIYTSEELARFFFPKYTLEMDPRAPPFCWRIVAERSFGNVRAGDRGGWVEGHHNLSHQGLAWVAAGSCVVDDNFA